jgi:polyphosphate kinase
MRSGADRYLNRELSWLKFNERVLAEAINDRNPLLERIKFVAIFESNLDEFYMVRVSGLIEQFESGVLETTPDGKTPNEQLSLISEAAWPLRRRAAEILHQDLLPQLEEHNVSIRSYESLSDRKRSEMNAYFMAEVFPLCTPLLLYPAPSVPFISNRSLNLAVELRDERGEMRLARVKVPELLPRLIRVTARRNEFVLLEDLIAHNLSALFPGVETVGSYLFRVIRDADIEIRELEAADLITTIEETLRLRRFGDAVLLEHEEHMPGPVRTLLRSLLELDEEDAFSIPGILGLQCLWELAKIDKPALRFPAHRPYMPEGISTPEELFEAIRQQDILVQHPYDSFRIVEELVESAVDDPKVIGIKQTLYRVGKESPITTALLNAASEGKQVAAMVELKARFDESNNLVWSRALERSGVHVTYGFPELKTHCKLCLVVRREATGVRQYAHIGTGNYNPVTARLYTDLGLFTSDPDICQDISELFNFLTGFSRQTKYRKILVAPVNLREGVIARVRREAKHARANGGGEIILKLNSLVDIEVIDALYDAAAAGVKIHLIVRGICCLRPGVEGLSDSITVVSVVGRFLEHSRVYYFANAGEPDVLIGSADAMRRNFDRRVEVLAPVESTRLIQLIHDQVLQVSLRDNVRGWQLDSEGEYVRRSPQGEEVDLDAQAWFMQHPILAAQFKK